jgi:hypothetical protein
MMINNVDFKKSMYIGGADKVFWTLNEESTIKDFQSWNIALN